MTHAYMVRVSTRALNEHKQMEVLSLVRSIKRRKGETKAGRCDELTTSKERLRTLYCLAPLQSSQCKQQYTLTTG